MNQTAMSRRAFGAMFLLGGMAACGRPPHLDDSNVPAVQQFLPGYGQIEDNGYFLPGIPSHYLQGVNRRMHVAYTGDRNPGDIEVDPHAKFLYLVQDFGSAIRYPIGVGRFGRSLRRPTVIRRKEEWPGWTPTRNMIRREPEVYGDFAKGVPGGLASPLGARALYLYSGKRDTFYRIHGTNDLESIGNSGSAGCIRLFNHDAIDLYDQVELGTGVLIRSYEDSVRIEGEALANRGIELPPKIVSPETIYGATDIFLDPGV